MLEKNITVTHIQIETAPAGADIYRPVTAVLPDRRGGGSLPPYLLLKK